MGAKFLFMLYFFIMPLQGLARLRKRNWILFISMILMWGSNWTVMKVGVKFVGPLNFVMQRFFLGLIVLLPILLFRGKKIPRDSKVWFNLCILSFVQAAWVSFTNIGLMYESSGLSSLLTYTQPLFVFCLAVLFLKERVGIIKVIGIMIGFLGVAVLYAGRISFSVNVFNSSLFFLILGAFLWAVTVIYYKKFLSNVDPVLVNIVQFFLGFAVIFAMVLMFEGLTFSVSPLYIFAVLYASIFGSAVASTIWLILIREEEATIVSASSLVVPVTASLFGLVFLGEVIDAISLLGFIVTLTGVYLVNK
ncbi:MAG: DMT family transporter [Candidatus Bathyarchaeia archaeon]